MRFFLFPAWVILAALATAAQAQTGFVRPDAGEALQSADPNLPIPPAPQSLPLDMSQPDASAPEADAAQLLVQGFQLQGNASIPAAQLLPLLDGLRGRRVTLGELREGVARLTQHYRQQGYLLAHAYLPEQTVEHGTVVIVILEGRYGNVQVDNAASLAGWSLAPLADLRPGDIVRIGALERSLLLVQDLPGVQVRSTLRPGEQVGTSDLQIDVLPGARVSGAVDMDNYGNRFVGQYRLGATLAINRPLGLGDRLDLRVLASNGRQRYGRVAWQVPVGPLATQVGAAYSQMRYELGKDFADLDAHGKAHVASVFLRQPLLRGRDASLSLQVQYDYKRLNDDIGAVAGADKAKRDGLWSLMLSGFSQDDWLGGGANSAAVSWGHGRLRIDGAASQALDAATARTAGSFNKFNASLMRVQRLHRRMTLQVQWQGQWASGNLDSAEKLYLGGAYGVRAYPQGEAAGDQGWLGNLELRYALDPAWQLAAFLDHGHVRLHKRPWDGSPNRRSLSGAGVGVHWQAHGWRANVVAAWKLGNAAPESDRDRSPRAWAQLIRQF